ncbi:hypothetical protein [Streptomyces sp. NPDC055186]
MPLSSVAMALPAEEADASRRAFLEEFPDSFGLVEDAARQDLRVNR